MTKEELLALSASLGAALPSQASRRTLGEAVADLLGPEFTLLSGREGFLEFEHSKLDAPLVLVPGGSFLMGLRDADLDELTDLTGSNSMVSSVVSELRTSARPCHHVAVRPFLCGKRPLTHEEISRLTDGRVVRDSLYPDELLDFLSRVPGMRLPAEAELEFLAREGGRAAFVCDGAVVWEASGDWPERGRFGVENLSLGEWCADAWHPNYDGAPSSSEAWCEESGPGVVRGALPVGPDQDAAELVFGLAAFRRAAQDCDERGCFNVRLCVSL